MAAAFVFYDGLRIKDFILFFFFFFFIKMNWNGVVGTFQISTLKILKIHVCFDAKITLWKLIPYAYVELCFRWILFCSLRQSSR